MQAILGSKTQGEKSKASTEASLRQYILITLPVLLRGKVGGKQMCVICNDLRYSDSLIVLSIENADQDEFYQVCHCHLETKHLVCFHWGLCRICRCDRQLRQ